MLDFSQVRGHSSVAVNDPSCSLLVRRVPQLTDLKLPPSLLKPMSSGSIHTREKGETNGLNGDLEIPIRNVI